MRSTKNVPAVFFGVLTLVAVIVCMAYPLGLVSTRVMLIGILAALGFGTATGASLTLFRAPRRTAGVAAVVGVLSLMASLLIPVWRPEETLAAYLLPLGLGLLAAALGRLLWAPAPQPEAQPVSG